MNFLQLLASGASVLNFNFQANKPKSAEAVCQPPSKKQGFQKIDSASIDDSPEKSFQSIQTPLKTQALNNLLENQRQELISRYLQLNIQLLEGKSFNESPKESTLNAVEPLRDVPEKQESTEKEKITFNSKKKIKKEVKCGHSDKPHYAKGMCNNCYHKYGRNKKPWNCPHQKLYAAGMCQNCYINSYNKKKREESGQLAEQINSSLAKDVSQSIELQDSTKMKNGREGNFCG